ncbi:Phospholipase D1-like protein 2 [Colletotrichum truncatum]|uniref:Phospholipase D1-like protein 2 n=1 Tax=Colletotrichum truncatum TaxID=5467 RepID=A0ACC3ZE55_COLTU|nr:Phospholipase D1-like protein 2 [Colletotrichum truncatum]KAF6801267.1 Phospholipase D1-like protein 2 [Colletotrichum truncatum]
MTEPKRDESVSPMTRSPRAASPAVAGTAGAPDSFAPPPPPKDEPPVPPPKDLPAPRSADAADSTIEARDYINGGIPHDNLSPAQLNKRPVLPTLNSTDSFGTRQNPGGLPMMPEDSTYSPEPASPTDRRSVQFARTDQVLEPPASHSRNPSWEDGSKSIGSAFMTKLKQLTGSGSLQTLKTSSSGNLNDNSTPSMGSSPTAGQPRSRLPGRLDEGGGEDGGGSDADADIETADEGNATDTAKPRKKRMMRRSKKAQMSVPSTPNLRQSHVPGPDSPVGYGRMGALRRRLSMPDHPEHQHQQHHGMSEGEGRDQLAGPSWMRSHRADGIDSPGGRRGHMRRITVLGGGGVSDGDAMTPKRPFFGSERASTWKYVKNTLKLLRQKKEDRFDFAKSAELMAELRAGAPAVLMLASMIQRDEHGNKRIPVLLEQVRLRITDSQPESDDDDSERHWVFTMDLEYGSGPSRMKWTIIRTLKDVYNLHVRYKLAMSNDKYLHGRADVGARPKMPKFPWGAFPYLRAARNKDDSDGEDEGASIRGGSIRGDETGAEGTAAEATAGEGTASEWEGGRVGPGNRKKSRLGMLGMRRKSTGLTDPGDSGAENQLELAQARKRYFERQRRVLEKYLQDMIRWLMFRADSNRLCKFLELSALGVRLAAEGSYHGKECYLHIQSSKGMDFRRVLTPKKVIARHSRKWFLVRSSYIVCVESPEKMNVYDVYLVDSKFRIVSKKSGLKQLGKGKAKAEDKEIDLIEEPITEKHHTLTLHTAERKVKLFSRNQHVMKQFEDSIAEMLKQTKWHDINRFDSFAPIRTGVFAQWLVDGRDYMWNVSRAISMARDVIYIHDWWLSPELYMRRPAAISQKWRLDRLLQRKAREGVKVFVIVYRNVEAAIPIDSEYTKYSLLNLHPNIFVQRSPNQFKKNQFFFAHHEKLCIVDHDVAFVGGIDLCFGRWDCPQHPLTDDKPTGFEQSEQPKDAEHVQLFPGKDYSNPRVQDFFKLDEPYEEMYDRSKVPRMPWHDIAMQVVGQPARDLTRHFVQRWNYIKRGRKTTRPLPFLLPPPDVKMAELDALGLTGTCEVQILRSSANWSLGIEHTEHSILNAYIKMIQDSDHFVYIENQFFITSTEAFNTKIVNGIGDALVERIIRAHENGEDWKACIIIPLMPGFQNTVDEQEGTSVRLILQCQYRSICRGDSSIFARLRSAGIEPEDYIQFYSLRQWGKIGARNVLVTEQLYIHAKCIIVDDRVALIGSANINERSMLGSRDSELAAVVRDTDMIWSTMAGRPYRVGRFAHTLRLRLMREHLGLDVDEILEEERQAELDRQAEYEAEMDQIYADDTETPPVAGSSGRPSAEKTSKPTLPGQTASFNHDAVAETEGAAEEASSSSSSSRGKELDLRVTGNKAHALDIAGFGKDHWKTAEKLGLDQGRDSVIVNGHEVLVHDVLPEGKGTLKSPMQPHERRISTDHVEEDNCVSNDALPPIPALNRRTTDQLGLPRTAGLPTLPAVDDTDIGGPPVHLDQNGQPTNGPLHPLAADIRQARIDKDCMRDPINSSFFDDVWNRVADNNTKLYRRVFRCMPDSEVLTWPDYQQATTYAERFRESLEGKTKTDDDPNLARHQSPVTGGGAGITAPGPSAVAKAATEKTEEKLHIKPDHSHHPKIVIPSDDNQEMNEKSDVPGSRSGLNTNTDVEKVSSRRPPEAPSPILPAGDVPFPAFEPGSLPTDANLLEPSRDKSRERKTTFSPLEKPPSRDVSVPMQQAQGSVKRRRRATTKGSRRGMPPEEVLSRAEAEELLSMIQGHVVQFPYDWLLTEEQNGNWGFQVDGVAPLQIYN